jgi:hypothetical protein
VNLQPFQRQRVAVRRQAGNPGKTGPEKAKTAAFRYLLKNIGQTFSWL